MVRPMRTKAFFLLSLLSGCGGAASYPLSIPANPGAATEVERAVAWVDDDGPSELEPAEMLRVNALREVAANADGAGSSAARDHLWTSLRAGQIESARYLTEYEGEPVWHQVTVGIIDLSYADLLERFDPAADWGRNLAEYLGGELAVDEWDEGGRVTLQRERMLLGSPWYAIGSPDLDMEKYEVIAHADDSTRVGWVVMASPNGSVHVDVGYLLFRAVPAEEGGGTLVVFNSVHRIETGIMSFGSGIVGDNIAGTFVAHIERYRRVLGAR